MQLLVSVRSAVEAEAALAGGADIVDTKEPLNGALGPVSPAALTRIWRQINGRAPLSVALGDIGRDDIAGSAAAAASAGAAFVKIGFAGCQRVVAADLGVARESIGSAALVLVAYADHERAGAPSPENLVSLAREIGAAGILLDTFDKDGAGLTTQMTSRALTRFVGRARRAVQFVALAGKLTVADVGSLLDTGADIIGVRGAACEGGRAGTVTTARVRAIRSYIASNVALPVPAI